MTNDVPGNPQPTPLDTAQALHGMAQPGDAMPVVLEQDFGRDSLYQLRAAVAAHAGQARMPPARVPDVVLAVSELVANVVRHGSGNGRLRIRADEHHLHCLVTDAGGAPAPGASADPGAGMAPSGAVPWPVEPGHGLWVVCRLADQASFDAGPPSTAAISFVLGPAAPPGGAAPEPS